ncbi:MAG TPA: Ig-like domain-containing protein [Candidatus Lustribacter sp.]|nr:Ig-like domain-containing protein [Candidatus Lustribacter sp.]
MKHTVRALLVTCAALFVTGCHPGGSGAPGALEAVAPASPAPAPPIVASYSPDGTVDTLAQIRVIFSDDLIPLEGLESSSEAAVLAKFTIAPALPGHFRFLTPRMIGFQADAALPLATRVRVTIAKGLTDLHGRALANDFSWTFQTAGIVLTDLPLQDDAKTVPDPGPLSPTIRLSSNAALDVQSLGAHASLVPESGGPPVSLLPVINSSPSPSPPPDQAFDASQRTFSYVLAPLSALAKGTTFRIVFAPGILPAHGNLASTQTFSGRLRTYGPLSFDGLTQTQADGDRLDSGTPEMDFSNPIDAKTLAAVHLSPAAAAGTAIALTDDSTIGINPALLAPNTDYTVTIDPSLADTFGQTLGTAQRATFRTTDMKASVWAPSGTNLFPASLKVALNVSAVNVPNGTAGARFSALQPLDIVHYDDPDGPDSALFALPAAHRIALATAGAPNVERTIGIPLREQLGGSAGLLAYTVASTIPKSSPYTGLVQLTNLGAFAQWFPDSGFVRVDRLSDGTPDAGAHVAIYRSQTADKTKTEAAPCASGQTGADGVARFSGADYAACAALDNGADSAPSLVTIVSDGNDWTYVRTDDSSGAYAANLYTGWSSATPMARGTIFSDRDLYQPGETAQLTAVGWFYTHGVLGRGKSPNYTVELQYPNQEKRTLPRLTLNAYGTASIPIVLDKNAPLGYYNVHVSGGNGETMDGSFRVAEFKPPNFSVTLALPATVAVAGSAVAARTTSTYLFGSPVAGASTYYEVTRDLTNYTWDKDPSFTFGRQWFWPENPPAVPSDVLQQTVPVDAGGLAALTVPVAADLPYPMTYRVDADTTDVANLSVGDSKSFTAFPGSVQIGLKTDFVATAGTAANISVIALDPNGTIVPQTKVHLELQLATYLAATAVVEGGDQPEQSVTYKTVASTDVTTAGAASDATETDVQLYVTGAGEAAWGAPDPNQLVVHLDKTVYKPGDVARALIVSPFPDADILVAVVRSGVLWQHLLHAHGSSPSVSFTVTPAMLPNAAFEAVAVRRGPLPANYPADGGNAVARNGFAAFNVALDQKYLVVTATPQQARLEPAAQQSIHLHVTDRAHHAVRGQVTLIVVNDAILQLSGYRPPDLVQLVYGDQPISTRFADNRGAIVLQTLKRAVDKGWGYGGGLSTGAEDTRIRRKFDPLAFYAGSIVTDADGNADASFTLPDDLTTWRVMAVAATIDGRFGNGESTFLTTKPLIVNPVVPQFARPGDTFEAGVAVTNAAGATGGIIGISGELTPPLAFVVNGTSEAATTFSAPIEQITKAYRFAMLASGPGTSTATFTAKRAGGDSTASDGFAIPVPVVDRAVMESVITTGIAQRGTATVPLDVAVGTPTDAGGVQLVLANSLFPDALVAANAVFASDDRVAIAAAGTLSVAADVLRLTALTHATAPTDAARAHAATALAFLASQQRADGGFASYPGATSSDPFDSLEVVHAYARAGAAGIPVAPSSRTRAVNFATIVLADPGAWSWCKTDPCKSQLRLHALDALNDAGLRSTSYLGDIDAVRDTFDVADRIRLARLLLLSPGYAARGAAEAHELSQRVYQTGALATFNAPERYRWFAQPVIAQALMTRLLLAQRADAVTIDKLTRSLLALRRNGSWGCACENAAALDALVDIAARTGPPPAGMATVSVGSLSLGDVNFFANHPASRTLDVPAAQLPRGPSRVTIALAAPSSLHYAVTYRYRLAGPQRGQLAGLRVTRIVHPAANPNSALATMGLALLAQPLTLTPAQVFDVELQVITDHPIDRVQITDPLPAGMEAVDTTFKTTNIAAPAQSWQIDDQQIFHDRIEAYADHLGPGIYVLHYIARTVTPGTFAWPGASARLIDRPEEFGRTASATLTIR